MKKEIILLLVGIVVVLSAAAFFAFNKNSGVSFGTFRSSGSTFNIYGTATNTTVATTTTKTLSIGSSKETINLNIKATSTAAQTVTIRPEFSNDSDCATAIYFRGTFIAVSGITGTVSTSTYSLAIPAGASANNVQISNLNTECLKLTISATTSSLLWIQGIVR
jgi:hypothetical protein